MEDEWITTREAANLTGYNAEHLRRLARAGKVQARKFGVVWQVDRTSLLKYLETEGRGPRIKDETQ